ncbi:putative uncharacterized protein [Ruminococcus sp. CAG:563]|nr:putative uncharacterized protein [Ruminococcus sp. CAG:563]
MTLKEVIKYRKIWMGFAILWVIFFHFGYKPPDPLAALQSSGYSGVDIFFFASGIGCYLSYSRDKNAAAFIKRRFIRIMPTYFVFIVIWCTYKVITDGMDFTTVLGNIFCVQDLTGKEGSFNWYFGAMWIFYLLTPYFVAVADKIKKPAGCVLFCLLLVLFSFPFWNVKALIIIVTRLPVYFLGMYLAKRSQVSDDKISLKFMLIATVLSIISMAAFIVCYFKLHDELWNYGLWWYPFIITAPTICLYLSFISKQLEKKSVGQKILKAFSFIGSYTFELFLVHVFVFKEVSSMIMERQPNHVIAIWFAALIPVAIGAAILYQLTKGVEKLIKKAAK